MMCQKTSQSLCDNVFNFSSGTHEYLNHTRSIWPGADEERQAIQHWSVIHVTLKYPNDESVCVSVHSSDRLTPSLLQAINLTLAVHDRYGMV